MNRGKRAALNAMASALSQIVSLICGFILPRLILTNFGSSYNGITSSVSQFLSVVALLRSGVVGATHAALYKPLANKDRDQISAIILATEKFMRKVALIFAGFIAVFSCVYPLLVRSEFDWLFTATLVLIISLSTFVQYFFGITYQLLLQADQRKYILCLLDIGTTILNTVIAAVLINMNIGIHGVKLGSSLVFCIAPLFLNIYVKRRYALRRDMQPDFVSINQRWDAFFHSVTNFVHNNTDIVLLTIFTNTKEISVYTVYYLVGHGLRKIVSTITVGIDAAFGSMLAQDNTSVLQRNFNLYELMIHLLSTVLFGAALVLITPFVGVYTSGITDVNYIRPVFGYLVVISEFLYVLRGPYKSVIVAAGHFKQTKKYAFGEAAVNLAVSLLLVAKFGLSGVVLGTLISIVYLTIVYADYASRSLVKRSIWQSIKRFAVTALSTAVIAAAASLIPSGEITGYLDWMIYAVEITAVTLIAVFALNTVFYRRMMVALMRKLMDIFRSIVRR